MGCLNNMPASMTGSACVRNRRARLVVLRGQSTRARAGTHPTLLTTYSSPQAFAADPASLAMYGLPLGIAGAELGLVVVRTERGVVRLTAP